MGEKQERKKKEEKRGRKKGEKRTLNRYVRFRYLHPHGVQEGESEGKRGEERKGSPNFR